MTLEGRVEQLLAYFNRGILDVPDGLFDKNAVLILNGVPYEMRLGRSADDPLVRLINVAMSEAALDRLRDARAR